MKKRLLMVTILVVVVCGLLLIPRLAEEKADTSFDNTTEKQFLPWDYDAILIARHATTAHFTF